MQRPLPMVPCGGAGGRRPSRAPSVGAPLPGPPPFLTRFPLSRPVLRRGGPPTLLRTLAASGSCTSGDVRPPGAYHVPVRRFRSRLRPFLRVTRHSKARGAPSWRAIPRTSAELMTAAETLRCATCGCRCSSCARAMFATLSDKCSWLGCLRPAWSRSFHRKAGPTCCWRSLFASTLTCARATLLAWTLTFARDCAGPASYRRLFCHRYLTSLSPCPFSLSETLRCATCGCRCSSCARAMRAPVCPVPPPCGCGYVALS